MILWTLHAVDEHTLRWRGVDPEGRKFVMHEDCHGLRAWRVHANGSISSSGFTWLTVAEATSDVLEMDAESPDDPEAA